MRLRVFASSPIGSCTPVMPRSPQTTPQGPIVVSKIAKCWLAMAGSISLSLEASSFIFAGNLGLENVAIHPNPAGNLGHQRHSGAREARARNDGPVCARALFHGIIGNRFIPLP